jgi:hypothetical protein
MLIYLANEWHHATQIMIGLSQVNEKSQRILTAAAQTTRTAPI